MGMFDYIDCQFPLPIEVDSRTEFQTKDTPAQMLDIYQITKDGRLLHEVYDIEDQSDPDAEGIEALFGCMTRINKRFVEDSLSGFIRFYGFKNEVEATGWIEFEAKFNSGQLEEITLIEDRVAEQENGQ